MDGKAVATVSPDRKTLRLTRHKSRHFLRSAQAWAISVSVLQEANAARVETVSLHDADSNVTYTAPLAVFFGPESFPVNYIEGDPQRGLELRRWVVVRPPEPDRPRQYSLFELVSSAAVP